jgi:hypothetical protein
MCLRHLLFKRTADPDDWQPRVVITNRFAIGELQSNDNSNILKLSQELAVSEKHVKSCIVHLENLKQTSQIRSTDRDKQKADKEISTYDTYDWFSLTLAGTLPKLRVCELDKYLAHHGLSKKGKKGDKIKGIMADCLRKSDVDIAKLKTTRRSTDDSETDDSEDETDIVLRELDVSSESELEMPDEPILTTVVTRGGRKAGSWLNAFNKYD